MTSAVWQPECIVVDSSDPRWRARLAANSPGARPEAGRCVVSFCDPAVGVALSGDWPAAVHWRDLVPSIVHDQFWRASYRQVQALVDCLKVGGQPLLQCYRHVLADALMRYRVWDYLAQTSRPAVVLLPYNSELRNRAGTLRHTQDWLSRRAGGKANLSRMLGWFGGRRLPVASRPATDASRPPDASSILMLVEDGVSTVHCLPALAIASELRQRGQFPRILTSNADIAREFGAQGHPVSMVRPRSIARFAWYALWRAVPAWLGLVWQMEQLPLKCELPDGFMTWFKYGAFGYLLRRMLLADAIKQAESAHGVEMVLALGETFPLVIVGLAWARDRGIANASVTPVLIGGRPDNEDFPASTHLVYGEQAAEWMRRTGVPAESIRVVGSTTYEAALARDKAADIERTRAALPGWKLSQRLVVLATEALPKPEAELVPALLACLALGDVHAVVKLHPADSYDAIACIISGQLGSDSRISLITTCNLEALLHAADLLVCVQSNISITAAILGTPTLCPIYCGRDRAVDLTEGGFATACASKDRLQSLIDRLTRSGAFRQGALDRMRLGIHRFAGKADGRSHVYIADAVHELIDKRSVAKFEPI